MSNEQITWSTLKKLLRPEDPDYRVIIPKVQRDYAQGREGERIGYIRRTFLDKIHEGLKDKKAVRLDFVYGVEKDKRFYPLDGQQRLTTLWLVHWYVFFMMYKTDGKFYRKGFKYLSKFSYETRESSGDFFECLCRGDYLKDLKDAFETGHMLADVIMTRTWFMTEWLNDPTIDAMLRTLSGGKESGKDCIESIIVTEHNSGEEWKEFGKTLEQKKLTFELQRFGNEKLPEDVADLMYVIMNGRGKALSDFENLKVDLLDEIAKASEKDSLHFAAKIDIAWTDAVWEKVRDSDNKDIAPMLFSFINRYVLNEMCFEKDGKEYFAPSTFSNPMKEIEGREESVRSRFDKVYGAGLGRGRGADDSRVRYDGFEFYKGHLNTETMAEMDKVFFALKDKKCRKTIEAVWEEIDPSYNFIPCRRTEGVDNNENRQMEERLERTALAERLYFYATCRFIRCRIDKDKKGSWYWKRGFSETEYRHWMRVAHNLIRNCYFVDVSVMVAVIRKLKECFPDEMISGDVYDKLADKAVMPGPVPVADTEAEKRFMAQFAEECEKARLLTKSTDCSAWETRIDEAENYGFFDGSIRFLYRDGSGLPVWDDLSHFDTKFKKAKELFPASKDGKVPADTAWEFLRCFRDVAEIEKKMVFTPLGYDDRNPCWKTGILCNADYAEQVDMMLNGSSSDAGHSHSDDYAAFLEDAKNKENEEKIFSKDAKGKYWITVIEPGISATMVIKNAHDSEPLIIDLKGSGSKEK